MFALLVVAWSLCDFLLLDSHDVVQVAGFLRLNSPLLDVELEVSVTWLVLEHRLRLWHFVDAVDVLSDREAKLFLRSIDCLGEVLV